MNPPNSSDLRRTRLLLSQESTRTGLFRYVEAELSDQIQPRWPQGTMRFGARSTLQFIIALGAKDPGKPWPTSLQRSKANNRKH